jgi:CRISPR-associated endonuclease/helicase Cas3
MSSDAAKYAHASPVAGFEWHRLECHLQDTAARAREFAKGWGAGDFAYLAGLWHDLGKYATDWQLFLQRAGLEAHLDGEEQSTAPPGRRHGPDHSSAGAIHAHSLGAFALPIQFAVAGHHSGLADKEPLATRLREKKPRYEAVLSEAPPSILNPNVRPEVPAWLARIQPGPSRNRALETFTRLLFSALVDADFLDTERFFGLCGPESVIERDAWRNLSEYLPVLERRLATIESAAPRTVVNEHRSRVLNWCLSAAAQPPGAYSLTVPTGGGKTLSSLAFALRHAVDHGLRRVIIALPFTSIVDQTVSVLRGIFEPALGKDVLVEHHSSIVPARETALNRVAAENWDAPLVVTTQVQLFESLFARRSSHCRKLHNLAQAVIILDEVQTLPAVLLEPILDQLNQLTASYGTTIVLTTATQPALHTRPLGATIFNGFDPPPREIVPSSEMDGLFGGLRRVRVRWPPTRDEVSWGHLAGEVAQHPRVLVIVHRRDDAARFWRALRAAAPDPLPIHLSALMCPAHRQEVLARVRRDLVAGKPCRLVSTQLVEAGVDLDFPVVYRAMAGLESIAQAAGRCNREGRLPVGDFRVFWPETEPPMTLRRHRDIAAIMLEADPGLDLMLPGTFQSYFDRLYAIGTDAKRIQPLRQTLCFEQVADRFQMIDEVTQPVFVPFGPEGRRAIDMFRRLGPSRARQRALQRFGVGLYRPGLSQLLSRGDVTVLHDTVHVLVNESLYDADLGLQAEGAEKPDLVV